MDPGLLTDGGQRNVYFSSCSLIFSTAVASLMWPLFAEVKLEDDTKFTKNNFPDDSIFRFSINPALKMDSKCFNLMMCYNRST